MSVSEVPGQSSSWPLLVRSWRVKDAVKPLPTGSEPRSPLSLLPAGLAERRAPDQRLAGVRPPIWVLLPSVVRPQVHRQPSLKLRRRGEVPPLEEAPNQYAEPQLHLVQPGAVFRGEHEPIAVLRVGQERPTLDPGRQLLRLDRQAVECGQDRARL